MGRVAGTANWDWTGGLVAGLMMAVRVFGGGGGKAMMVGGFGVGHCGEGGGGQGMCGWMGG